MGWRRRRRREKEAASQKARAQRKARGREAGTEAGTFGAASAVRVLVKNGLPVDMTVAADGHAMKPKHTGRGSSRAKVLDFMAERGCSGATAKELGIAMVRGTRRDHWLSLAAKENMGLATGAALVREGLAVVTRAIGSCWRGSGTRRFRRWWRSRTCRRRASCVWRRRHEPWTLWAEFKPQTGRLTCRDLVMVGMAAPPTAVGRLASPRKRLDGALSGLEGTRKPHRVASRPSKGAVAQRGGGHRRQYRRPAGAKVLEPGPPNT
jgi:hypothetical protein